MKTKMNIILKKIFNKINLISSKIITIEIIGNIINKNMNNNKGIVIMIVRSMLLIIKKKFPKIAQDLIIKIFLKTIILQV